MSHATELGEVAEGATPEISEFGRVALSSATEPPTRLVLRSLARRQSAHQLQKLKHSPRLPCFRLTTPARLSLHAPPALPTMPVPASRSPSPSPLFTVGPVPSGAPYLGATAIATIPKGTLVVNERPLFTLDAPLQSFLFQRTVMAGAGGGPTPVEGEEDEAEVMARFEELHGRPFGLEDWMERAIRVLLMTKTEEERVAFDELAATQEGMELTNGWNIFTTNAIS